MKRLSIILFFAALIVIYFALAKKKGEEKVSPVKTISFSFVGDLMCHSPQYQFAQIENDSFDFKPAFGEVKSLLSKSDFTIGNLETVTAGKELKYGSYPMFNTPISFLDALTDSGFDILVTCNNHSLDRGIKGVNKTIDELKKRNIFNIGTYQTADERDSILVIIKNGIKVALLGYTYGLNGNTLSKEKDFMISIIDTVRIKNDLLRARNKKVDLVLVYYHFGEEYQRKPNQFQRDVVTRTIEYGADAIIASHPHVIQKLEFFQPRNKNVEKGFVAYSLGNFISNQRWRYSDCGVILNFSYEKNDSNKISLDSLGITPTWVYKGMIDGKKEFVIIPADSAANKNIMKKIPKGDREKAYQSFLDTKAIMNEATNFRGKILSHKL